MLKLKQKMSTNNKKLMLKLKQNGQLMQKMKSQFKRTVLISTRTKKL